MPTRAKAPRVGGEEVRRQVQAYLKMLGVDVERANTGAGRFPGKNGKERVVRFGVKGDPDLQGFLPDKRPFGIECKAAGEYPRPEQYARLERINANGGVGLWCDSLDFVTKVMPHVLAGAKVKQLETREGGPTVIKCRRGCKACKATGVG